MGRDSEPDAPLGASTDLWGDVSARSGSLRWPSRSAAADDGAPGGADPFTADPFAAPRAVEDNSGAFTGPLPVVPPGESVDGVLLGVIRRLRTQASRQAALAERLRASESRPGPLADLAELAAVARRTRRDADTLLTLAGAEPVRRADGPVPLGPLIGEVLSGVEDASRVVVSPPASATLQPVAADGLGQALTELLAHAAATTAPGSRIDLVSHWTDDGGVAVEVLVGGLGLRGEEAEELERRLDEEESDRVPAGDRVGVFVAARLARRSGLRVGLRTDPGYPPAPGLALVAAVRCAASVLARPSEAAGAPVPPREGSDLGAFGTGAYGARGGATVGNGVSQESPATSTATLGVVAAGGAEDLPLFAAVTRSTDGDDPLFGPLAAGALLPDDASTPIYAEVASAWFRSEGEGAHHVPESEGSSDPLSDDWGGAQEWQAATERAAQPDEVSMTSSGLPQRRPGRQMVPPPRNEVTGVGVGAAQRAERVPDLVRSRLSSYQRGLREGRHRASDEHTDVAGD